MVDRVIPPNLPYAALEYDVRHMEAFSNVLRLFFNRLTRQCNEVAEQTQYVFSGIGSPEGVLTAPPGSLYSDLTGGGGTTFYIKEAGTGNTGWVTVSRPFDVHVFYPSVLTASAVLLRVPVARAVSLPANLSGSYGKAGTSATGSTAFNITKNGTTIGTATFAAGAAVATFTTVAGAVQSLVAGDVLGITAPVSADATLADVGFVLAGTR